VSSDLGRCSHDELDYCEPHVSGAVRWAHPPGLPTDRGTVATVGTFDGVHLGHWSVLQEISRRADAGGRRSVLVTFDPHPLKIVRPEHCPPLLTTPEEKKEILAESGLDYAVFLSFTPALSRYDPRRFVEEILLGRLGVEELVIGYDHGFGRDRSGDSETLTRIGAELGFAVDVVPPVNAGGEPVSSSRIRAAVQRADLAEARACPAASTPSGASSSAATVGAGSWASRRRT
jgi:riboflavin kinase/FMN adenylyltransferase